MGVIYTVGAVALGVPFLILAARVLLVPAKKTALPLYLYSLLYLALLFVVIMVDSTVRL